MDKKDIHNTAKSYAHTHELLKKCDLSTTNKKTISEFVKDCENGDHHPGRRSRPVGQRKLMPYIYYLKKWTSTLKKEWKKITNDDLKNLCDDLRKDTIKSHLNNRPYSESTKTQMLILLKLFVNWLAEKRNTSLKPSLIYVSRSKPSLPSYMSKEQVELLAGASPNAMYQALILGALFDAGLRIEEALNLKIKDINYLDTALGNKIMRFDIRISKTDARNPELLYPGAQDSVERWLRVHPDRNNPDAFLFVHTAQKTSYASTTYDAVRIYLHKLALKVKIGVRVYPHLFRHSSATYYASRMNRQQLCIRYGWKLSSDMPDIYIRRSGMDNQQVIHQVEGENLQQLNNKNKALQQEINILRTSQNSVAEKTDGVIDKLEKLLKCLQNKASPEEIAALTQGLKLEPR